MTAPLPDSLEALMYRVDIIVIGTIGDVLGEETTGPSIIGDDTRAPGTPPYPENRSVRYAIQVEEVILDDGTLAAGTPLILSVGWGRPGLIGKTREESGLEIPMPQPGEQYLLFLRRVPGAGDNVYGSRAWDRIHLEGEVVRFPDWDRTPVDFTENTSPEAFVAEVRQAAQRIAQDH